MKNKFKIHPLCEMFPVMTDEEIKSLADDIKSNGQRQPILIHDGQIIDGRNRMLACEQAEVEPVIEELTGDVDLKRIVRSLNLERRHLDESQRAMLAAEFVSGNGDLQLCKSTEEAAEAVNVSVRSVNSARKVKKKGSKALQKAVRSGKVKVSVAEKVAKLPKAKQAKALKRGAKGLREAAAEVKPNKRAARGGIFADMQAAKEREASEGQPPMDNVHVADGCEQFLVSADALLRRGAVLEAVGTCVRNGWSKWQTPTQAREALERAINKL